MLGPAGGNCGRYQHVVAFVFGSDQGADEQAAYNLINNDFTSNVFLCKVRQFCMEHTLHLTAPRNCQPLSQSL